MKRLIKKILREEENSTNPVGEIEKKFFIVAKILSEQWDDDKFDFLATDIDLWDRRQELNKILKLVSWDTNNDEANELFWLTYDNREGLRDGTIKSYSGLTKRLLQTYSVRCETSETEYNLYEFDVLVDAYDKDDAYSMISHDEDGQYNWWDWEDTTSQGFFEKTTLESESGDLHIVDEPKIVENLGGTTRKNKLKEQIKASPEENDILSELKELITNWEGCEKGMRIACKYKNQVQELIDRYKNKGLYEHKDNFMSHYNEPHIGEPVVNTNPGCVHYKSEGFIEDINDLPGDKGTTITYRVTNNGNTYKEGDTLTKTMDQLSPMDFD
ncbi:hypothetical protein N9322_00640 [bacterium]|jgi:hypothetical protein|nr:hypothetical protein [bacterium]|tara:strand:+ start:1542 stop:2525 length:984 start_codon:yes stop_codon:yes gene_type:complete